MPFRKTYFLAIGFCLCAFLAFSQKWASCGLGFVYQPTAMYADTATNKLYVSGFGAEVDSIRANWVAAWDGTKWDTLGHGAMGAYGSFLTKYQNKLYLERGGYFDPSQPLTPLNKIFSWDFSLQKWDTLPGKCLVNGDINGAVEFNGDLILVGQFNKIAGVTVHNIARFDGTNFYPVGFPNFTAHVNTVAVYQNEIYIGGNFGNDTIYNAIARWNGSQWLDVDGGFRQGGPPEVVNLHVYNNRLYAGGAYYGTKNAYNPSLAVWDGIKWNNIGGIYNNGFPWGVVYTMFEWNKKLFVGGGFNRAGDMNVDNLAIWNDTVWCSANIVFESPVGLATAFQNTMYIGQHYKIDNDSVRMLGRWIGGNYINACGSPLDTHELANNFSVKIFPNPATHVITITSEDQVLDNATIRLTNYLGQPVLSVPYSKNIDVSALSSGCYFIEISTQDRRVVRSRFIKE